MSASASKKHKTHGSAAGRAKEKNPAPAKEDKVEGKPADEKKEDATVALEKRIAELLEEAAQYKDEAQRAKADLYNYRTKVEKDRSRDRVLAAEGTIDSLLPVLDNLDRTLQAVPDKDSPLCKGVAMVQRQFLGALQALGLQVIDTGGAFDPAVHEAVMAVDVTDDQMDGMVLEELFRGYKLGDKVLRAAQVKVGKKK